MHATKSALLLIASALLALTGHAALAETAPLTLGESQSNHSGYAIRLGERLIGVCDPSAHPSNELRPFTQKTGWALDLDKMLRPGITAYIPFQDSHAPIPAYTYVPNFTLNQDEPLQIITVKGDKITGQCLLGAAGESSYNPGAGFRVLELRCEGAPAAGQNLAGSPVTKMDGKQVVGTVFYQVTVTAPGKSDVGFTTFQFEPLLVGHPVFRQPVTTSDSSLFGKPLTAAAAKDLPRWISPAFFKLAVGAPFPEIPSAVPAKTRQGTTSIGVSGDTRSLFWSAGVSTRDGKEIERISMTTLFGKPLSPDTPLELVRSLTAFLGEPSEAFSVGADRTVFLRYPVTPTSDLLLRITRKEDVTLVVSTPGTDGRTMGVMTTRSTKPLPKGEKELIPALQELWKSWKL